MKPATLNRVTPLPPPTWSNYFSTLALILSSANFTSSSTVPVPGSIGSNTSHFMGVNVLSGYNPYLIIFQLSVIATGTSKALGHFFNSVATPAD